MNKYKCLNCNGISLQTKIDEPMENQEGFVSIDNATTSDEFVYICPCCGEELIRKDFEKIIIKVFEESQLKKIIGCLKSEMEIAHDTDDNEEADELTKLIAELEK